MPSVRRSCRPRDCSRWKQISLLAHMQGTIVSNLPNDGCPSSMKEIVSIDGQVIAQSHSVEEGWDLGLGRKDCRDEPLHHLQEQD